MATFSRTTTVTTTIHATAEIVWAILTNAEDFSRWNSTITSIDGIIEKGKTIRLKTTLDPKRTFTLKVVEATPPTHMTWKSGQAPFFQGVRTYQVTKKSRDICVFTMTEKLSGLMFPLAAGSIPDFKESFDRYAADLKKEAETIMNIKN
ncbi:MAG TPA: SRPBCC domain-containing protein [Cyclobacteriaceae bacterium]|nr:SRPBCC domain-containing protein [Cyclobacteriaceae bacterium]